MKTISKVIVGLVLIVGLGSCGVNQAYVFNQNQNTTQVHLGSNNFKVVGQATGKSDVNYVLIFGGKNKKQLYKDAYAKMIEDAELKNSSSALINVLTEEQLGGFPPFYYTRTVTVSANIVAFTE